MPSKPLYLTGGAYKNRSLIANAQRCVNLYLEKPTDSSQSPVPFTLYTRAGLRELVKAPMFGIGRGIYQDSLGNLYMAAGTAVYYVSPNFGLTKLGEIAAGKSIISWADNGTTILLVDGTPSGYLIDMASKAMSMISDPAFYGANSVNYVRTVFVLNRPGTRQFYISGSNSTVFDALDFGQKTSSADPLVSVPAFNDQIWLLGTRRGEVWYWSGDALFPFQQLPGVVLEHGCGAVNSPATTDKALIWLTQDKDGKPWIAKGSPDYSVQRVSTHALEEEIQQYIKWDDAVGYTYQMFGHTFYDIVFPSADKTWSLDLSTEEWSQYVSIDVNGNEHRMRGFLAAYAYNTNVMVDWKNGSLYALDPNYYADGTDPIKCVRGFPHLGAGGPRVSYPGFLADMEVGAVQGFTFDPNVIVRPWSNGFSNGFGPYYSMTDNLPRVSCRMSNSRGYTYGNKRRKSLGATGEYRKILHWNNWGQARDAVFELEWAVPCKTALNCGYLMPLPEVAET